MNKTGQKIRDIRFFSEKNQEILIVHTKEARAFTRYLEENEHVLSYIPGKGLLGDRLQTLPRVGIRGSYFDQSWETDFYILYDDDRVAIRELVKEKSLKSKAEVEKLELSRRYWKCAGVTDWKAIQVEGG